MVQITRIGGDSEMEVKDARFQGMSFPSHFHDTYSIGVITQGVEIVRRAGVEKTVFKDKVVVFNAGEVHSNRCHDEDPWAYRTLNLSIDRMRYLAERKGLKLEGSPVFNGIIDDVELAVLLTRIKGVNREEAESTIEPIVLRLLRYHRSQHIKPVRTYVSMSEAVAEIKDLLSSDLFGKPDLGALGSRYGKSSFQVLRAFRSHTGLTPREYRILLRVNRAKSLIRERCSLTDVAMECGFYDQSHFIHTFTRFLGVSPSRYREGISTC